MRYRPYAYIFLLLLSLVSCSETKTRGFIKNEVFNELKWEKLNSNTYRLKLPNGWLVRIDSGIKGDTVFVPMNEDWHLVDSPDKSSKEETKDTDEKEK